MLQSLTGLRFLFAFLVFMSHCGVMRKMSDEWSAYAYNHVFRCGGYGVFFFFLLSGFILSHAFGNRLISKDLSIIGFYKSRIKKLFPLHLFCFLVCMPLCLSEIITNDLPTSLLKILSNLSLTQSYFNDKAVYFSFNSPTWSLSNELFFYLLFPFITGFHYRICNSLGKGLGLTLLLSVIATLYISIKWFGLAYYANPLQNLCYFLCGIAFYSIRTEVLGFLSGIKPIVISLLEWGLLGTVLFVFMVRGQMSVNGFFTIAGILPLGLLVVIISAGKGGVSAFFSHRLMVWLGQLSFSFYMIHQPVIRYLVFLNKHYLGITHFIPFFVLLLGFSLIASFLLHQYVEKKFMRISWKRAIGRVPVWTNRIRAGDKYKTEP